MAFIKKQPLNFKKLGGGYFAYLSESEVFPRKLFIPVFFFDAGIYLFFPTFNTIMYGETLDSEFFYHASVESD